MESLCGVCGITVGKLLPYALDKIVSITTIASVMILVVWVFLIGFVIRLLYNFIKNYVKHVEMKRVVIMSSLLLAINIIAYDLGKEVSSKVMLVIVTIILCLTILIIIDFLVYIDKLKTSDVCKISGVAKKNYIGKGKNTKITYEYTVDGVKYVSSDVRGSIYNIDNLRDAKSNEAVPIYYNSNDPNVMYCNDESFDPSLIVLIRIVLVGMAVMYVIHNII